MWLKTLQRWLDHRTPASDERCEEAFRTERELKALELRKLEDALRNFHLSPRPAPASGVRENRP